MEYQYFGQDFKNLLNHTIKIIRLNEPNDIGKMVKDILNSSNLNFSIGNPSMGIPSNYTKLADKVIEFLLHSKFIESYGNGKYVLTEPKGMKVKQLGSLDSFFENESKENDKKRDDLIQTELIKELDKKVKEQQLQINAMELRFKPWAFRIAITAVIISLVSLVVSTGLLQRLWKVVN